MKILALLQFAIFLGYAIYIARRFGVLQSISTSSYILPKKEQWKFTAMLWSIAILNIVIVIMGYMGVYGIISAIGIVYTGITISHREGAATAVHYVGVLLAIASQFAGFALMYNVWLPLILLVTSAIGTYLIKEKWIWYIEIIAMALTAVGYLMI